MGENLSDRMESKGVENMRTHEEALFARLTPEYKKESGVKYKEGLGLKDADFTIGQGGVRSFTEGICKTMFGQPDFSGLTKEQREYVDHMVYVAAKILGLNMNRLESGERFKITYPTQNDGYHAKISVYKKGGVEVVKDVQLNTISTERIQIETAFGKERMALAREVSVTKKRLVDAATKDEGLVLVMQAFVEKVSFEERKKMLQGLETGSPYRPDTDVDTRADHATIDGMNKYLKLHFEVEKGLTDGALDTAVAKHKIEADGTGYRGTAEQNQAWVRFIRHDMFEFPSEFDGKVPPVTRTELKKAAGAAVSVSAQVSADAPAERPAPSATTRPTTTAASSGTQSLPLPSSDAVANAMRDAGVTSGREMTTEEKLEEERIEEAIAPALYEELDKIEALLRKQLGADSQYLKEVELWPARGDALHIVPPDPAVDGDAWQVAVYPKLIFNNWGHSTSSSLAFLDIKEQSGNYVLGPNATAEFILQTAAGGVVDAAHRNIRVVKNEMDRVRYDGFVDSSEMKGHDKALMEAWMEQMKICGNLLNLEGYKDLRIKVENRGLVGHNRQLTVKVDGVEDEVVIKAKKTDPKALAWQFSIDDDYFTDSLANAIKYAVTLLREQAAPPGKPVAKVRPAKARPVGSPSSVPAGQEAVPLPPSAVPDLDPGIGGQEYMAAEAEVEKKWKHLEKVFEVTLEDYEGVEWITSASSTNPHNKTMIISKDKTSIEVKVTIPPMSEVQQVIARDKMWDFTKENGVKIERIDKSGKTVAYSKPNQALLEIAKELTGK